MPVDRPYGKDFLSCMCIALKIAIIIGLIVGLCVLGYGLAHFDPNSPVWK